MILVRLGNIIFGDSEVPESINGGGTQMQSTLKMIGGKREIHALGRDDSDISFKGLFRGILSEQRLKYLDGLRVKGEQIPFSYSSRSYLVVVKSVTWTQEIAYQFHYEIVLNVVQDLNSPVNFAVPLSFNDILTELYQESLDIATFLNAGGVIGALGLVGIALSAAQAVGSFTIAEIASLSGDIADAIASVNAAIDKITNSAINTPQEVINSIHDLNKTVNTLAIDADTELAIANLYRINDLLSLMQRNLDLLISETEQNKVFVSFGNLFEFASKYYGDPTLWTALAENNMNSIKDDNAFINPNIDVLQSLVIPPKPQSSNGGILRV